MIVNNMEQQRVIRFKLVCTICIQQWIERILDLFMISSSVAANLILNLLLLNHGPAMHPGEPCTLIPRNHQEEVGALEVDSDTRFGIYPLEAYGRVEFFESCRNNSAFFSQSNFFLHKIINGARGQAYMYYLRSCLSKRMFYVHESQNRPIIHACRWLFHHFPSGTFCLPFSH